MLFFGAHVHQQPALAHQVFEVVRADHVAVPVEHVFGHVTELVDGVLGRRERRGIGQLQVGQAFRRQARGHGGGYHVDAFVDAAGPHHLSA